MLEPGESEATWDRLERAIIRFAAVTRGGAYKHMDAYVVGVGNKGVGLKIVDCVSSTSGFQQPSLVLGVWSLSSSSPERPY